MEVCVDVSDGWGYRAEPSSKVAMVCRCSRFGAGEYYVFVVDLNLGGRGIGSSSPGGRGSTELEEIRLPTFRLSSIMFFNWDFCMIGSSFYAIEAYDTRFGLGGRGIYRFDLPDDEANMRLDITMLSMVCQMQSPKMYPTAIASPDGKKILVYSSSFVKSDRFAFELFDPVQLSCCKLPRLPSNWVPGPMNSTGDHYGVLSLTFISDSEFLLKMDFGIFTMDIGARVMRWKRLTTFYGGLVPDISYRVKGDDLCLTPFSAYSLTGLDCRSGMSGEGEMMYENLYDSVFRWHYYFPESESSAIFPHNYEYTASSITLMEVKKELLEEEEHGVVFGFCTLKAGMMDSKHVHVTLNSYWCNLHKCREELIRNREREEEDQQLEMHQIKIWAEEMQRMEYGLERCHEFTRKRDCLLGNRNSLPLPATMMVRSLQFCTAEQYEDFFLCSFASIPASNYSCRR